MVDTCVNCSTANGTEPFSQQRYRSVLILFEELSLSTLALGVLPLDEVGSDETGAGVFRGVAHETGRAVHNISTDVPLLKAT